MQIAFVTIAIFTLWVIFLRGGSLHNHLVLESETIARDAGCSTNLEHAIQLPDGRLNFIDLLAQKENVLVCIEVETSARNILSNAAKAEQLDLPLLVVVPNRKVQKEVTKKLAKCTFRSGGQPIYISLLNQLNEVLADCLSDSPSVNVIRGKKRNK